jgi:urea carboxylase-associated protein 2
MPETTRNTAATPAVDAIEHWRDFAADLADQAVLFSERIPGGAHWSWRLPRGTTLRLTALGAHANLSMVLYCAQEKLERYNMPDSLKAQHTAHYTRGHVLMSDMGRAMASITADSLGWHDPLGLLLDARRMAEKYGTRNYQGARNDMYRPAREGLLVEIGKYGLSKRDLITPVNFFSRVTVDEQGSLHFVPGHSKAGDHIDLRLDMDVIVAVSAAPHPLDPGSAYAPADIGLALWRSGTAPADDYCRSFRRENARALHNSDMLYLD